MNTEDFIIQLLYERTEDTKISPLFRCSVLHKFMIRQDINLMQKIKNRIQDKMWHYVTQKSPSHIRKELFIKQSLCYLMQLKVHDGECFIIPEYNENTQQWLKTDFICEKHLLTPSILPASDHYHAFKLVATDANVIPWVLLMSTTYPSNQGAWATYIADFYPFSDIGYLIAASGQRTMKGVLNAFPKIRLVGQSLGGALALYFMEKNCEVTLINPALPYLSKKSNNNNITALVNESDLIPRIGNLPNDTTVYLVQSMQKSRYPFLEHIQSKLQFDDVVLEKTNARSIQSLRSPFWVFVVYWPCRFIIFCIIWPLYLLHIIFAYILQLFSFFTKTP